MRTLRSFAVVVSRDPLLIVCAIFLVLVLALAVFGGWLTGYDANQISAASLQPPSRAHWFGTDLFGRDLLTRTLEGARISLLIAAAATAISLTVGVTYGMISGYVGGRVDNLMMRLLEIIYALPTLILVIVLVATLEDPATRLLAALGLRGVQTRIVLLFVFVGLTEWLTMARIIRGQVLVMRQQAYVQAAFALGRSHRLILWRHLLPNLSGIILVYLTLTIPAAMLDESFLSFLGLGVQAPKASWGTLISEAAQLVNPIHSFWWMLVFPGALMAMTLLALNFLGDGLRDALDPRSQK
jgi:peptide/nickel transport system permease protein/oligopeptide transport system permease protein